MGNTLRIDFTSSAFFYRYQHLQGSNELIIKAIGWRNHKACSVMDATAGLGKEAFLMAAVGCQVTLFERQPVVAEALRSGLLRASLDPRLAPVVARMRLFAECAVAYLRTQSCVLPEVIYCDPMFAPRKKSAAVKKEIQLLQTLVKEDKDASELVALALQKAKKRVVVKRPIHALPLVTRPDFYLKARAHRYDVYLLPGSSTSSL